MVRKITSKSREKFEEIARKFTKNEKITRKLTERPQKIYK